jgi:hypothetical protein
VDFYLNCDNSGLPNVPKYGAEIKCPDKAAIQAFENAIHMGFIK